ncbi:oxygenase [Lithospermum erythrorhizon]|uniref:Oxygenase n=1 Tax=Lithospermum erythrorhizon TaxID=34254 RepID=A0AAV3Q304_LITER
MEALKAPCFPSMITTRTLSRTTFIQPMLDIPVLTQQPNSVANSLHCMKSRFKHFSVVSSSSILTDSTDQENEVEVEVEVEEKGEKFDWYAHWYPVMPVCDLDKRRPHGKKVIGIDIVIWWDKADQEWKVFDDACPHRLAPLSEGRIDQWGRLQCVYHGWCFNGAGDCKFIPQAPRDGPPIHTSKRACVAAYPSCVQNSILWFWPNTDPQYKDILSKKKPPYIPEIDDPSYTKAMICRDIPYGYEVLIENLMDPAHKLDVNGFSAKQLFGANTFIPPCLYYGFFSPGGNLNVQPASSAGNTQETSSVKPQKRALLAFFCIPVSPGNSRIIFTSPRNFGAVWLDKMIPPWIFHIGQNLILDSDLYLLHVEERKLTEVGALNWHKSCFVPTKADALVSSFRRWLNKYCGGKIDWKTETSVSLPPTPPREQLFDRYWSHVVNCKSCSLAYKSLNVTEIMLQVVSIALLGVVAAMKQNTISVVTRTTLVSAAILCFVASKWLSKFIYKNFHYHDYDHAFR